MGRAGSGSELESVTYGSTGTDQSIPIVETLSNTAAGCTMHVATFSILCRTPPGIAGPHYWKITVAGQATQEMVKTEYSRPQINDANITLSTAGNEVVILAGTEFGTHDDDASFRLYLSRVTLSVIVLVLLPLVTAKMQMLSLKLMGTNALNLYHRVGLD